MNGSFTRNWQEGNERLQKKFHNCETKITSETICSRYHLVRQTTDDTKVYGRKTLGMYWEVYWNTKSYGKVTEALINRSERREQKNEYQLFTSADHWRSKHRRRESSLHYQKQVAKMAVKLICHKIWLGCQKNQVKNVTVVYRSGWPKEKEESHIYICIAGNTRRKWTKNKFVTGVDVSEILGKGKIN